MASLIQTLKQFRSRGKQAVPPYNRTVLNNTNTLNKTLGAYCELSDLVRWKGAARRFNISKRRRAMRRTAGPHRSPSRGRGMEFEDVRQYQAGDDIRHIDWRVSARVGKTHTKQFREEREIPILLVLDQRQSMFFGSQTCMKSVMACDIMSLLAWSGLENGDRLGGIIFENNKHHEIRPKKSRATVLHLLNQSVLANHGLNTDSLGVNSDTEATEKNMSMHDMLSEIKRLAKPGFQIFIVSDFHDLDQSCLSLLRDISLHCECTAIQITDPLEKNILSSAVNTTNFSQSQTVYTNDGMQTIHPQHTHWQTNYHEAFIQHQQNLQQLLDQFRIQLLPLSSNDEPAAALQQYFAKR